MSNYFLHHILWSVGGVKSCCVLRSGGIWLFIREQVFGIICPVAGQCDLRAGPQRFTGLRQSIPQENQGSREGSQTRNRCGLSREGIDRPRDTPRDIRPSSLRGKPLPLIGPLRYAQRKEVLGHRGDGKDVRPARDKGGANYAYSCQPMICRYSSQWRCNAMYASRSAMKPSMRDVGPSFLTTV